MTNRRMQTLGFLLLILFSSSICQASIFDPISDIHRSAALELFTPVDGSFKSLEDAFQTLRTFEILGIGADIDRSTLVCPLLVENLKSTSSSLKDIYYALRCGQIVKCEINRATFEGVASRLQSAVKDASALLDLYYSIGGLVALKDQTTDVELQLTNAEGIFRTIKALSQSDGRWRYDSNNPESSTRAAGMAFEALAGVVSLASSNIDQSMIASLKNDIVKLFDSIEKYDDGSHYFEEKIVDAHEHQGPLSTTSSVVRGLMAFADVSSTNINVSRDKILGLAKFFLGVRVPGNAHDFFDQLDALAHLESNKLSVPLILSFPATVISLSGNDLLKVKVSTVLGSNAPPLAVRIVQAAASSSKATPIIENQELRFDAVSGFHILDSFPKDADIGTYEFVFKISLHDSDQSTAYATGGRTYVQIYVTGVVAVDNAEIAILDSDLGSVENKQKLDLASENSISLSANHLQKLRLSFHLTSPLGNLFNPHQALLSLRHDSKLDHVFVVRNSGKQFEIILDFLGLVDKLYYLSGRYDLRLTIGDAVMENSFCYSLGHIDLELPEAPEKANRPSPQPVDPYSRYGPKAEITHVFRTPEKRPAKELSLAFLGLTLLPLIGFLIGLLRLGVNLKNFPESAGPATFALLFHIGIAAVLCLYVLFWVKLDLFTTLKILGFLGFFLVAFGHRALSHLASTTGKVKAT